eukprot:CAMPEP_0170325458 /NCGR_PEP_ID=MMETSP0116_2-20130129/63594_1 /TAXON_ID=400756 /ORGANISM="Durinskia baltica, Strain CSIRO CS-38" /LENGTH=74 /DNA_ID=CAMNT_0010578491 /DNA_START=45 /DNA_END=265 /DNA_ORIENTATION=-
MHILDAARLLCCRAAANTSRLFTCNAHLKRAAAWALDIQPTGAGRANRTAPQGGCRTLEPSHKLLLPPSVAEGR